MGTRTALSYVAMVCIVACSSLAIANPVVFTFNASDFLNVTPAGPSGTQATQDNARQLNVRTADDAGTQISNFNTYSDQVSYDAYMNWLSNFATPSSNGICEFSVWLRPDWGSGYNRGVNLGFSSGLGNDGVISVAAPAGWSAGSMLTQWGNYIMYWYTTDPTKYIRQGSDLGQFSFKADLSVYDKAIKLSDVAYGSNYRVYFWADNYDEALNGSHLPSDFVVSGAADLTAGGANEMGFYATQTLKALWTLPGDPDGNGVLNVDDVTAIVTHFGAGTNQWDINSDGAVNNMDVVSEATTYLGYHLGDGNFDHKVGFTDFQLVLNNWHSSGMTWQEGEFTGDGNVTFTDFQAVLNNWNPTGTGGSPVPEPATLSLLLIGAVAAIRRGRKS